MLTTLPVSSTTGTRCTPFASISHTVRRFSVFFTEWKGFLLERSARIIKCWFGLLHTCTGDTIQRDLEELATAHDQFMQVLWHVGFLIVVYEDNKRYEILYVQKASVLHLFLIPHRSRQDVVFHQCLPCVRLMLLPSVTLNPS